MNLLAYHDNAMALTHPLLGAHKYLVLLCHELCLGAFIHVLVNLLRNEFITTVDQHVSNSFCFIPVDWLCAAARKRQLNGVNSLSCLSAVISHFPFVAALRRKNRIQILICCLI